MTDVSFFPNREPLAPVLFLPNYHYFHCEGDGKTVPDITEEFEIPYS